MKQIEIKNAIIKSASINMGDRELLTADLELEYGDGSSQVFGGYALYLPKAYSHHEIKSYAGHFIFRCMQIAGVEDWKDLIGKSIRVKASYNEIYAIGNIIKDDWFNPKEDFSNK